MNRGSPGIEDRSRGPWYRFNEAPIHESGKSFPRRRPPSTASRFNEAPIHESGKCRRSRNRRREGTTASMRPRFMNRGSHLGEVDSGAALLASMRPRFMNRGSA